MTMAGGGDPSLAVIPSEDGWLYHATNEWNAQDIADSGSLVPHPPDYGTDQESWPDGGTEDRSYWTGDPQAARSFYPEGSGPVLLRAPGASAPFARESTGDYFLREEVPAAALEAWTPAGWVPLRSWGRTATKVWRGLVVPSPVDLEGLLSKPVGRHWSTDPNVARGFADPVSGWAAPEPNDDGTYPPYVGVTLEGEWDGDPAAVMGEDEGREGGDDFKVDHEDEVRLRPGTPVDVDHVVLHHDYTFDEEPELLDGPRRVRARRRQGSPWHSRAGDPTWRIPTGDLRRFRQFDPAITTPEDMHDSLWTDPWGPGKSYRRFDSGGFDEPGDESSSEEDLVEAFERGDRLPPVEIVTDGKGAVLADGNHRVEVADMLSRPDLESYIWFDPQGDTDNYPELVDPDSELGRRVDEVVQKHPFKPVEDWSAAPRYVWRKDPATGRWGRGVRGDGVPYTVDDEDYLAQMRALPDWPAGTFDAGVGNYYDADFGQGMRPYHQRELFARRDRHLGEGPWYHASGEVFEPGRVLLPGDQVGSKAQGRWSDGTRVWVSNDPVRASAYGFHLYEVEPADRPRSPHGNDEHHTSGATVLREVPEEQVNAWRRSYDPSKGWQRQAGRADAYGNNWPADRPRQTAEPSWPEGKVWYHRSDHDLPVGTVLTPGGGSSRWDSVYHADDNRRKWVWLYEPEMESFWGLGGTGKHLYQVVPEGGGPYPWNDDDSQFVAPRARIVRRLDGAPKTAAGDLVLYHGTVEDRVPGITESGLAAPAGVNGAAWPMLTTDYRQAAEYVSGRPGGVVLEYRVPASAVWRHGAGEEAVLWPGVPHTAYDRPGTGYGLRRPLGREFLRRVHKLGGGREAAAGWPEQAGRKMWRGLMVPPGTSDEQIAEQLRREGPGDWWTDYEDAAQSYGSTLLEAVHPGSSHVVQEHGGEMGGQEFRFAPGTEFEVRRVRRTRPWRDVAWEPAKLRVSARTRLHRGVGFRRGDLPADLEARLEAALAGGHDPDLAGDLVDHLGRGGQGLGEYWALNAPVADLSGRQVQWQDGRDRRNAGSDLQVALSGEWDDEGHVQDEGVNPRYRRLVPGSPVTVDRVRVRRTPPGSWMQNLDEGSWTELPGGPRPVTARRLAMPAPNPAGLRMVYHPTQDTVPPKWLQTVADYEEPVAPMVTAHVGNDPVPAGYLTWYPDGEVRFVHTMPWHRRHGLADAMFDYARQVEPRVHHSQTRTRAGQGWVTHEEGRAGRGARRLAALADEFVAGLQREFDEWAAGGGAVPNPYADRWPEEQQRGPVGYWPNVEAFLKERYPAAHKGFSYGLEDAAAALRDPGGEKDLKWLGDRRYEQGPEAEARYGYDPSMVAAGMVLLHTRSHPKRRGSDLEARDEGLLLDIFRKRQEMQRAHEARPVTLARVAASLPDGFVDRLGREFDEWVAGGGPDRHEYLDEKDEELTRLWARHRGPIQVWPYVESFLKERYPAAHRGFRTGLEQAVPTLDGKSNEAWGDAPAYPTGPGAVEEFGYDPAGVVAGLMVLHNRANGRRQEWEQADQARLVDIFDKRRGLEDRRRGRRAAADPRVEFVYHPTADTVPAGAPFLAPAVEARVDGKHIGYLEWEPELRDLELGGMRFRGSPPTIAHVNVVRPWRRRGVGRGMLELARRHVPGLQHSDTLTDDGKAWSARVGAGRRDYPVGINVSDEHQDFTGQILRGEKTVETRNNPRSLAPYVGRRVGLVRTHRGKAALVGWMTVGEPVRYGSDAEFDADYARHLVGRESPYHPLATPHRPDRWGFPLTDVEAVEPFVLPDEWLGNVSRRVGAVEVRHKHYPRTGEDSWHAWDGDREVGTLWVVPSGFDSGTIADVDVHPDYRRRGIATQLWEAAGRPAHSVNYLSGDGQAWASAVGGDMDTYE